ncbi:MAG: 7TM diverse intracellular signaling domain-containing protein [Pedobacter sp.]
MNNNDVFFFRSMITSFLMLCLSIGSLNAQIVFSASDEPVKLGKYMKYYIDSSGRADIQAIRGITQFKHFVNEVPDLGIQKTPVWLKIEVTNTSSEGELSLQFDQSPFREIEFYYPNNGRYDVSRAGQSVPFTARMLNFHKYIYDLTIPIGSTETYYFKILSTQNLQLPISLTTKPTAIDNILLSNLLFGVFFGVIAVMFFYNLFIYFTVDDSIYLYYVVYILIVGLTQATIEGYSFQYLWPESPYIATRAFFVLTALVNISGLEFARRFLNIKILFPVLSRAFFLFYIVYSVAIALTLIGDFGTSYTILQFFAGIVSVFILFVSIRAASQNYRPAKFFLLAWLPLLAGIFIYVLREFGILPYNSFTNYSITLGSMLEVILLSFALADKINIYKKDKEESQEATLQALKENERIVLEQNIILEKKVVERTEELMETNEMLNITLTELKEAQSQLVDSEKMAGLGQLTAGIAHEINNPINFVTSNIKPLELDILDLDTVIKMYESLDTEADLQPQIARIESFKKQIDIVFVRDEIKSLLSGIGEGARRTAEIIRSLKNFSRLDENDTKPVDLNEGIASTLVLVKNTFPDHLQVVKDFGDLPPVECLPGKINQVFMNLITNAVHAIKSKEPKDNEGILSIKTWQDGANVKISIKDSGTGMPDEVKQKIFEPFFTTKDVGEGTGLGLSIVFRIIENHNGNIDVITKLNQGTEFIITLPINSK